jgi:hypothetical protein
MAGFFVLPTGGPEHGVEPEEIKSDLMWNRAGATLEVGQVCTTDFGAAVAELATGTTATYIPGTGNTVWNSVTDATATSRRNSWVGVVINSAIANDARGKVQFYGLANAFVLGSAGVVPGTPLNAQLGSSGNAFTTSTTGRRFSAVYLAPQATLRSPTLSRVMLYGCCNYVVSNT